MSEATRDSLSKLVRDPALEQLELMLRKPNLFYILRLQNTEIRHSNFLAWLFNPRESHQLGSLFLRHFLRGAFSERSLDWIDEFKVDQLNLDAVNIRREWQRIDLLIETPDFVIAVENKFRAAEHSRQLRRYRSVVEKSFPERNQGFIFLTPKGTSPSDEEDEETWNPYSYNDITQTLETILTIHGTSMAGRVRTYIEDYLVVLRREIMANDELILLAQSIYESHREAMDLILEHRPDRLAEVTAIFEELVRAEGWIPCSKNKGFTRFLTPELHSAVPRSGTGWPGKEAFAFEFDYWPKHITFRAEISPCNNEGDRRVISGALKDLEGAIVPKGKIWLVFFTFRESFDVTNPQHTDEQIRNNVERMLPRIREIVSKVEPAILRVRSELSSHVP